MASLTSLLSDPPELLRAALTKLEGELNALAAGSLRRQTVVRVLHRLITVSQGAQRIADKLIGDAMHRANLPTYRDVADLSEALRRIEAKLDHLLADVAPAPTPPRPARTRRPPIDAVLPPPPAAPPRRPARRGRS